MALRAVPLALLLVLCATGAASAGRSLHQQQPQQQRPQQQLDLGGIINQGIGLANQGLQGLLNGTNSGTGRAGNASRPLADIANTLSGVVNNQTRRGNASSAAAPAGAAAPSPDGASSTLLANATDITSNITAGIGSLLGNLTRGAANMSAAAAQQQQQAGAPAPAPAKSSAGAGAATSLAGIAAAATAAVLLLLC